MRAVLLVVLAACAPAAPRANPVPRPAPQVVDAGLVDMAPAKGADVPALDELAKTEMPLMRIIERVDDPTQPTTVTATDADTCFRAVVAASAPVRAWFVDAAHTPRGEIAESAGPVPPRGPVCAKKGEALRLVIHRPTAGTITRAVIWASP